MNVEGVRARAEVIRQLENADARCHQLEDELRREVLKAIAAGHPDAQRLAQEALLTDHIEFDRWCA